MEISFAHIFGYVFEVLGVWGWEGRLEENGGVHVVPNSFKLYYYMYQTENVIFVLASNRE